MKVLLINPIFKSDNYWGSFNSVAGLLSPIGLLSIASSIRKEFDTKVLDCQNYEFEKAKMKIKQYNPDVIGISSTTPTYLNSLKISKFCKELNKTVILGGVHCTAVPKICLSNPNIDIVVIGEGDATFPELLKKLEKNKSLKNIQGIAYKEKNNIKINKPRPLIDINKLDMPSWALIDPNKYASPSISRTTKKSIALVSGRGCPYQCSFCSKKIFGTQIRYRNANLVLEEIKFLKEKYNKEDFVFYDDIFTVNKKRVYEIAHLIKKEKLDIGWCCDVRANLIDGEMFTAMKKSGCYEVGMGIESGSQRILNMIKKQITLPQVINATRTIKKVGLFSKVYFIIGFPNETKQDIEKTVKLASKIDADYMVMQFFTPYPGTELFGILKTGTLFMDKETYTMSSIFDVNYLPEGIKKKYLLKMASKAYRGFYWNPKRIMKYLSKIKNINDIKKGIDGSLSILKNSVRMNNKQNQQIEFNKMEFNKNRIL